MSITPFDFLNSINETKVNIIKNGEASEKDLKDAMFIIRRGLSLFPDSILYANEMNIYNSTDPYLQYEYFLHGVRKAKRRGKWPKNLQNDKINLIRKHYHYNTAQAISALKILTEEQVKEIKSYYESK